MTDESADYFGSPVTRAIWSNAEIIVLIYIGSAADFALNQDNHWLFYTMELPRDPERRFIQTFKYNQKIFFSSRELVPKIAKSISDVHKSLEEKRGMKIPNRAFLEVGDMLIDYGIRGYEYLHQKELTRSEKESYYQDMRQFFELMGVQDLSMSYEQWQARRKLSVNNDLKVNPYTANLYESYRKAFGRLGYFVVRQFQSLFVPEPIRYKLNLRPLYLSRVVYKLYPYISKTGLFSLLQFIFLEKETRQLLASIKNS